MLGSRSWQNHRQHKEAEKSATGGTPEKSAPATLTTDVEVPLATMMAKIYEKFSRDLCSCHDWPIIKAR